MKLKIEINMDNDALKRDPIGEVIRMIKLGIRKTELTESCKLQDINGQTVGKLEIIKDLERTPTINDFTKGEKITITAIISNSEITLEDFTVTELNDRWMLVEKHDESYVVMFDKITQM